MSVAGTGKRTFFHDPGTNDLLDVAHFDFSTCTHRILHLGLLSVHALLDKTRDNGDNGWSILLRKAQAQGIKTSIEMVSIDPERNRRLVMPCLALLDYLIVNDDEIGAIARRQTTDNGKTDIDQCIAAAREVLALGSMEFVTVHFPQGAICITRDKQIISTASLSVPQHLVKGSVGAGDAFVAGFLYAIHERWSLTEAMTLAHTVAACSLRAMTSTDAVESVTDCQRFAEQLLD
jgi:sugar/nucleoside kinase (ribokinase family)